jgi:hypothetical protein
MKIDEPKAFSFYALGDPQPRNNTAVDYLRKDILPELILDPGGSPSPWETSRSTIYPFTDTTKKPWPGWAFRSTTSPATTI